MKPFFTAAMRAWLGGYQPVLADEMLAGRSAVRDRENARISREAQMAAGTGWRWTPDLVESLQRDYSETTAEALALRLGFTKAAVYRKANSLGLRKSTAFLAGPQSGRLTRETTVTHGCSSTREYRAWIGMRRRCTNPKFGKWHLYGGKGVQVCDRWMNSFAAFLEDMGPCPVGLSIERISGAGDYEPGNCVWATSTEQANNTSQTLLLTINGETKPFMDWVRQLGLPSSNLVRRHIRERGWPIWRALGLPSTVQASIEVAADALLAQQTRRRRADA